MFDKLTGSETDFQLDKVLTETLPDATDDERNEALAVALAVYESDGDRQSLIMLCHWDHSRETRH